MKVIYIGIDTKYWGKLKKRFSSTYSEMNFTFQLILTSEEYTPYDIFERLYFEKASIIYLDLCFDLHKGIRLAKLMTRNNEMRLISLVSLFQENQRDNDIIHAINAGVRLNHIKCREIHDVVYDPISFLDVNLAQRSNFVRSHGLESFEVHQPLRVAYIEENHYHIETNSYLDLDGIIVISGHPLEEIIPSRKFFAIKYYDHDLYYNKRFAYDLEFTYIEDDFFSSSKKTWELYKKVKDSSDEIKKLPKFQRIQVLDDIEKRKNYYNKKKKLIDDWVLDRSEKIEPKKLKVMVIDNTLEVINKFKKEITTFPYALNLQTVLLGDYYQIKRTMPHLIAMKLNAVNDLETLSLIIKKIEAIKDYQPFILLFSSNHESKELQGRYNYEYLLSRSENIHIEKIKEMAEMLDKKMKISDVERKVFLRASDPESTMFLIKKLKVLGITESVLYLESSTEIPMWTVFIVKKPIQMLLTIVPHRTSSPFPEDENCYRCLINGIGESGRSHIRRLINTSLSVECKS